MLSAPMAAAGQEKGRGERCAENPDKLYNRRDVLERFAAILNASIPEFGRSSESKYYVTGERPWAFSVHDLTDPSNVVEPIGPDACIEFIDHHIYHVVPVLLNYSFSHIIIPEGGNLKVFKSINCKGRGDTLEDVLKYLRPKLAGDKNKDEIINRVINYRQYGRYTVMDNFSGLGWACKPVDN